MAKYRCQLILSVITIPIIVEAYSESEAKELLENLLIQALTFHADSVKVTVPQNQLVRVADNHPATEFPPPRTLKSKKDV
jgi:mannose/fructose-specific phosphotransferase system component IIA